MQVFNDNFTPKMR